jgi:hypothetical protein
MSENTPPEIHRIGVYARTGGVDVVFDLGSGNLGLRLTPEQGHDLRRQLAGQLARAGYPDPIARSATEAWDLDEKTRISARRLLGGF